MYSSTCLGRPYAHHQELNNCSSSLWFYRWSVVVAVLLFVVGPTGRLDHDQQHCYHHAPTVKPEAATAVVELLMMGMRTPETCWAVHKRQVINLRDCCIWLVDLLDLYSWEFYILRYWAVIGLYISWCVTSETLDGTVPTLADVFSQVARVISRTLLQLIAILFCRYVRAWSLTSVRTPILTVTVRTRQCGNKATHVLLISIESYQLLYSHICYNLLSTGSFN